MKGLHKIFVVAFFTTFFVLGCQSGTESESTPNTKQPTSEHKLPDGIYWLRQTDRDSNLVQSIPNTTIIKYSHLFVDTTDSDQPLQVWIDTTAFVPLSLAEAPDSIQQEDQRIKLMLTMSDDAGQSLAEFTTEHVNDRVAMVIDGEAMTIHKIREPITGGKLQITRCTDRACSFLFLALQDNVK